MHQIVPNSISYEIIFIFENKIRGPSLIKCMLFIQVCMEKGHDCVQKNEGGVKGKMEKG